MSAAMFKATVNGLRTVPSRKVVQVVLEAPIEQLPYVASICKHGSWQVVARLCNEQGEADGNIEPPDDESRLHRNGGGTRSWDDISAAEQAGLLCNQPGFWRYLHERRGVHPDCSESAAAVVRQIAGVSSRKDITPGTLAFKRWQNLVSDYRAWQLAPRLVG